MGTCCANQPACTTMALARAVQSDQLESGSWLPPRRVYLTRGGECLLRFLRLSRFLRLLRFLRLSRFLRLLRFLRFWLFPRVSI